METAIRSTPSVRFESFELNLRTGELYRNGLRLKLRGHPIDVLAILLEQPGELVTRDTLRKRLWPGNTFVAFEQILNNSVGKLRDALGDQAESPRFIETLPRLGYRFIAPVDRPAATNGQPPETSNPAGQDTPPAQPTPALPQAAHPATHRISKLWIIWPLVALAAAFAALGIWYMRTPLPTPRITHYEQLTLDGRRKNPIGTDGARIYVDLPSGVARRSIGQIPVSGGKITEIPIEVPAETGLQAGLQGVSPDGSSLLLMNTFVAKEGFKVWLVGTLGHPTRYLTRAYAATWFQDGRTIVFANAHGDIYTIPADGGEPRLLHRENAPAGEIRRTRYLSCSPDGTTIRFTRWGGKIYEMSSTGANFHEWLPDWNGSVLKCCGRWTPDGQFFLFLAGRTLARGRGWPASLPLGQIWAVDERHGRMRPRIADPVLLGSDPLLWGEPVPSRDGKMLFARGVSLRGELVRYDSTSKRLESYLGGISADMPDFSHDGKYVAYVSFPDGILWRANRDGSGVVQLTEPPFYPRNPRWSPDGKRILFTDYGQDGVETIYVVSSQGGTPERLLPNVGGRQRLADWSTDGKKVVYSTSHGSPLSWDLGEDEIRIAELETGKVTELAKSFWAPLWSPDGRHIAAQSSNATELGIFDLKTGDREVLAQNGDIAYHNWSHDGRFIYFIRQGRGAYRTQVLGSKEVLVFKPFEGFRGTGWYGGWMSLDPTDAPLLLRDVGTDEIYALTLETK